MMDVRLLIRAAREFRAHRIAPAALAALAASSQAPALAQAQTLPPSSSPPPVSVLMERISIVGEGQTVSETAPGRFSENPWLSADGRIVVFSSGANVLERAEEEAFDPEFPFKGDDTGQFDVYLVDRTLAVCNALGSDLGRKWRFVTHYAHFDGGIADLRRHATFDRLAAAFLDPTEDLDELMDAWQPCLRSGVTAPEPSRNGHVHVSPPPASIKVGGY